jgi:pyridinium-3,5-biscarboxylic acid mononucleotide sulfurtransferase
MMRDHDRPGLAADELDSAEPALRAKWLDVLGRLADTDGCVVSFSGGADSSLVLAAARRALGDRALAATVESPTLARGELDAAREVASLLGARLEVLQGDELEDEAYAENPSDRCYHCKRHVLGAIGVVARRDGVDAVVDGTNADDLADDRPGRRAAVEAGVLSPLAEAGVTKSEVRELSRLLGLPTWDKPALACLASRIPHGSRVTPEKLAMIDDAERAIRMLGFPVLRVRHHGSLARVEVPVGDLSRAFEERGPIVQACRDAGFRRAALDLVGYHSEPMRKV